jgi:hypothetical protein
MGGDSLSRIRTHPDRRNTSDRGVLLLAGVSNATTGGAGSNDLTQKVTSLYPEKRKTKINE